MADEEQNENVEETTARGRGPRRPRLAEPAAEPEAAAERGAAAEPRRAAAAAAPEASSVARRAPRRPPREAGSRPPRTPEERQAERDAARKARAAARRTARAKLREKARRGARRGPAEPTPPREHGEGRQKERQGVVVSDKADKTITVRIDTARQHRRYHKIVRSSTTLHAHDESNDAHIGDTVACASRRPLSRLKRWRLVEVVERAR